MLLSKLYNTCPSSIHFGKVVSGLFHYSAARIELQHEPANDPALLSHLESESDLSSVSQ